MSAPDPACRPYRLLARNARLANARLDRACMALAPGEWEAPRISFFPSLKQTMVHLLDADRWYIGLLRGESPDLISQPGTRSTPADFAAERAEVDDWLVAFAEALTVADLQQKFPVPMEERTLDETLADALLHVFMHGTHHRGQLHAMLSATSVPPPQLDEFILGDAPEWRADDLARLGWSEERLRE